jgi:hypothetical protein
LWYTGGKGAAMRIKIYRFVIFLDSPWFTTLVGCPAPFYP